MFRLDALHKPLKRQFQRACTEVIQSGRFILGEQTEKLEQEWAQFVGANYAVATSSGSSALIIALLSAGIQPGDHVLVPAFTFIATVEAVRHCGAVPILVDVDPHTGLMDLNDARNKLSSKTTGLIPVHLYGNVCDMDEVIYFANEYGLFIVEDACQAHGSLWRGEHVGTFGSAGCFSFYPTKNLGGLSDGGILVTQSEHIARLAGRLRNHGRHGHYIHTEWGSNYRISEFSAGCIRIKLQYLQKWLERRSTIFQRYCTETEGHPYISWIKSAHEAKPGWHLATLRTPYRDDLRSWLDTHGIDSAVYYHLPVHEQPVWKKTYGDSYHLPGSEQLAREVLSIPLYSALTEEEVSYIIDVLKRFEPGKRNA